MRSRSSISVLLAALAVAVSIAPATGQTARTPTPPAAGAAETLEARRQRIFECFQEADYEAAIGLIEAYLQESPNDSQMIYNLACALCQTGRTDQAASALLQAVKAGFSDLDHLRSDPDLEALSDHPTFRAIFQQLDKSQSRAADHVLELWRATYGDEHYRYEKDEARKIAYATALDETSHLEMKAMLTRQADHLTQTLFGEPPPYYILIAVPTTEDADAIFSGRDNVGGQYKHDDRRLIARNIGGSLRHEFVHALHFAHMERLGLKTAHRFWVQEGLASLYEDYQWEEDGSIRFVANNRHNTVRNRARAGRLTKWSDLFDMTGKQFMARSGRLYPQVRSMFRFIADSGKLEIWYASYVATFQTDPGGATAFEQAFGQPLEQIEKAWRQWVMDQPAFDDRIDANDAALGIRSNDGLVNDGVVVTSFTPGSAARDGGLRIGDVIVSVDGRATRTLTELTGIIGAGNIGDEVVIRIRRGERYQEVSVRLRRRGGFG